MLIFVCLLLFSVVLSDEPVVEKCENQTNYIVPYRDGKVFDPANDGDCWSYDDHVLWHEDVYNESEYSELHLKEEQKDCIESACTNFYYGHIDINLLETCATHKCRVLHHRIDAARNCSALLVSASRLYDRIRYKKNDYDKRVETNRSMIEYNKHDFLFGAQSVLDENYDILTDFQTLMFELTKIMDIKDPDTEMKTFDGLISTLATSINSTKGIENHISIVKATGVETKMFLQNLKSITKYVSSYTSVLKLVKEYIDHLRDNVIHQYVFGSGTCDPLEFLFVQITEECNLCENGLCEFQSVISELACTCDLGWKGITCHSPQTSCDDNPCIHDGICVDEYNTYRCECLSEWSGIFCEVAVGDSCVDTPCQHGSSCQEHPYGYSCNCTFGWTGRNCQYSMKDCSQQNPCDNGQCHFDGNRISCKCPREDTFGQPFWKGSTCSYEQLECNYDSNSYQQGVLVNGAPCSGHGLCTLNRAYDVEQNPWTCVCDNGYFGERCEILIDTSNTCLLYGTACLHGSCDSCTSKQNCTCECYSGWEGQLCTDEINECDPNPCKNDAPCRDQFNDFYCDCSKVPGQFGGKYCEEQVTCIQQPCGDGVISCNDESLSTVSNIKCVCNQGWIGDRCEKRSLECTSDMCFNGGNCIQGIDAFCQCLTGWSGDRCQYPPTYCDQQPCGTTGTCLLQGTGYRCECIDGWEGKNCNHNIDECLEKPCVHGTCLDKVNSYTCLCEKGWRGVQCDVLKSPCDHVTCSNNGICLDTRLETWTRADFECLCATNTCRAIEEIPGKKADYRLFWVLLIVFGGLTLCVFTTCASTKRKRRPLKPLHEMAQLNTI